MSAPKAARELAAAELGRFTPRLAPNIANELKRVAFGCVSHLKALGAAAGGAGSNARADLLAGGFDSHGAFVTGASFVDGMPKPQSVTARAIGSVAFTVLGEDYANGHARLSERLNAAFGGGRSPEAVVPALLEAGMATMRMSPGAARVGYRVLHRGRPAETGVLDRDQPAP
jgi:hypothetical protein